MTWYGMIFCMFCWRERHTNQPHLRLISYRFWYPRHNHQPHQHIKRGQGEMAAAQRRCLSVGIVKRCDQTDRQRKKRSYNNSPQTDLLTGFFSHGSRQRFFICRRFLILCHLFLSLIFRSNQLRLWIIR